MHIFVANLLKCNFCKHLIIAEFISIPTVQEIFDAQFPVWSSLYRYSIAAHKNKPLVSRVHPQGICQNRFLFLRERSSEALVTLFWAKSSTRVKRSAPMVCHALVVYLWGLGVPVVDFPGVPLMYCMLLLSWYSPSQLMCWLLA